MALPESTKPPPNPELLEWQRAYQSALRETNKKALFTSVEVAEAAILTRREGLTLAVEHHTEWQVLEEALASLRILKSERLKFRASKK
jgi:hypothetical protein